MDLRLFLLFILILVGCESEFDNFLAEDHDSDVRKVKKTDVKIKGLSGIARGNGRLFVVSDRAGLLELNQDFSIKDTILKETELEGVTVDEFTGDVWVCQERKQVVLQINPDTKEIISKFSLTDDVVSKNRGLEGIVFDPISRTLFIVREKHKPSIFQVSVSGVKLKEIVINIDDLSDITINKGDLFLLSQEGQSINKMNQFGGLIKRWHIPLKKAEGLVFNDDGTFLVVDDEEKELFQFKFKD